MLSEQELKAAIEKQQPPHALYPLEVFCRACGTGHLATPGWEQGRCRKCDAKLAVFVEHPVRQLQRARVAA